MPVVWAVLPAAGRGSRFGGEVPKQYLQVAGQPLIAHALDALLSHPRVAGAMVALAADDGYWPGWTCRHGKPVQRCTGGGERADSVLAALLALPPDCGDDALVLVHDAARPNLQAGDLDRLLHAAAASGDGALLAAPLRDTLKRADADGRVAATEPRQQLWRALTPQAFRRGALTAALLQARRDRIQVTDEAMAMERAGFRPVLVEGREDNLKVTTPADRDLAEFLLARRTTRLRGVGDNTAPRFSAAGPLNMSIRIGQGYDVHAFGEGDHIALGGVRVPHDRGVLAHSDGDVVIHALCDAILGALALGDIGTHFPPSDPRWKDADSRMFLRHCRQLAADRGWVLGNADITVICERPKVGPHVKAIREVLADDLGAAMDAVSVKATTSEKLGFTGRGEGIAAMVACLLVRA